MDQAYAAAVAHTLSKGLPLYVENAMLESIRLTDLQKNATHALNTARFPIHQGTASVHVI
jgi:hypothetical protein